MKILGFAKPDWELMRTDLLESHAEIFIKVLRYVLRVEEIAKKSANKRMELTAKERWFV
jgi:hypothetical protein